HSFAHVEVDENENTTNADGTVPKGGLILSGNTLYGTTWQGGTNGNGTIFEINKDGTGFALVHTFSAMSPLDSTIQIPTNTDGAGPFGGLVSSGNTLYGTTTFGGFKGKGTVFSIQISPPSLVVLSLDQSDYVFQSGVTYYITGELNFSGT